MSRMPAPDVIMTTEAKADSPAAMTLAGKTAPPHGERMLLVDVGISRSGLASAGWSTTGAIAPIEAQVSPTARS
jgi:hypothetical protein